MKRLLILLVCGISVLLLLSGCRGSASGVNVVIEGGGKFPEFLVGTWKADKEGWELVFEPDGTVSSAVDGIWQERLKPHQKAEVQGRKGEPGLFEAGDYELYYDPESREISVIIEIRHIYLEIGGGILDGTCEYFITGNVWEDEKTWNAHVATLLDLAVLLPDPNSAGEKPTFIHDGFLRTDPNEDIKHVIFTKVESTAAKNED